MALKDLKYLLTLSQGTKENLEGYGHLIDGPHERSWEKGNFEIKVRLKLSLKLCDISSQFPLKNQLNAALSLWQSPRQILSSSCIPCLCTGNGGNVSNS